MKGKKSLIQKLTKQRADCHIFYCFAVCRFVTCRSADCFGANSTPLFYLGIISEQTLQDVGHQQLVLVGCPDQLSSVQPRVFVHRAARETYRVKLRLLLRLRLRLRLRLSF